MSEQIREQDLPGIGRRYSVRAEGGELSVADLDEAIVVPEPSEVLQPGDRVVVVGRPEDLDGFVRHASG